MEQSLDTDHDGIMSIIDSIQAPSRGPEPSISSHPALIFNLTQCDDTAILKVEVVPIQNFPTTLIKTTLIP